MLREREIEVTLQAIFVALNRPRSMVGYHDPTAEERAALQGAEECLQIELKDIRRRKAIGT